MKSKVVKQDIVESPQFITLEKAAELLSTNKRHIRRMLGEGKIRGKDISLGTGERKRYRVLYQDVVKIQNGK